MFVSRQGTRTIVNLDQVSLIMLVDDKIEFYGNSDKPNLVLAEMPFIEGYFYESPEEAQVAFNKIKVLINTFDI